MRILDLTTELPYFPGGTGGNTRQYYLLRRLAQRGHRVVVVGTTTPSRLEDSNAVQVAAEAGIELRVALRSESRAREALVSSVRHPSTAMSLVTRPWLAWRATVFTPEIRPKVDAAMSELWPDVVLVEHDHLAHWCRLVDPAAARVLMTHNVSWELHTSRAHAAKTPLERARQHAEATRHRAHAKRWFPSYDLAVATSDLDARAMRRYFRGPVRVVANGADFSTFTATPRRHEPPTLLFTGTMFHPPNAEGILWFLRNTWHLVRKAVPSARLLIVGRQPPPKVLALGSLPNVRVVESVPDIRPWFRDCTAVIVPLLSGGGTRLKIIEALACGRAVVSTTIGAEGLDLERGEDLLIADTPAEFAASAVRLLTEPVLNERLAATGRAVAQRRYDWSALGDQLDVALSSLVH